LFPEFFAALIPGERPAEKFPFLRTRESIMDVYQIVTDKIVSMLEAGVMPWRKPWSSVGLPRNLVSKKPYRGINVRREVA
jgi:antirestriction protein ArdC